MNYVLLVVRSADILFFLHHKEKLADNSLWLDRYSTNKLFDGTIPFKKISITFNK